MQPAGNFLMKWKLVASSSWAARYISYLMVIWYHKITRMLSTGFSLSWNLLTNISLSKHYHPILRNMKKILNNFDVLRLRHIQNKNTFSNCTNSGVTFILCHIYKKNPCMEVKSAILELNFLLFFLKTYSLLKKSSQCSTV